MSTPLLTETTQLDNSNNYFNISSHLMLAAQMCVPPFFFPFLIFAFIAFYSNKLIGIISRCSPPDQVYLYRWHLTSAQPNLIFTIWFWKINRKHRYIHCIFVDNCNFNEITG